MLPRTPQSMSHHENSYNGRGLRKRARSISGALPKLLIPINDKPVLQYEFECLVRQGFTDIILTVSHTADKIQAYFGDGSKFDAKITYYIET